MVDGGRNSASEKQADGALTIPLSGDCRKIEICGGEKMFVYSVLMFAIAVLFLVLGLAIYQGNTKLIHDYHQTHIKESERQEYGRAFSKGMFTICATLIIS